MLDAIDISSSGSFTCTKINLIGNELISQIFNQDRSGRKKVQVFHIF
jgi:hypothetical protein